MFITHIQWTRNEGSSVNNRFSSRQASAKLIPGTTANPLRTAYLCADTETKILMGKLTAIVIIIHDLINNDGMYDQIAHFAHRIWRLSHREIGILLNTHAVPRHLDGAVKTS